MLHITFQAFIYVMAFYGIISVIGNVLDSLSKRIKMHKTNYKLVISVKNQQDTIEGIIREIFQDDLFSGINANAKVVVIDKGSTDETLKILKKLQMDYEGLEIVENDKEG